MNVIVHQWLFLLKCMCRVVLCNQIACGDIGETMYVCICAVLDIVHSLGVLCGRGCGPAAAS